MQKRKIRIIAFAVAVIMILGASAGLAMAKDISKLIFSGVTMEAKADGSVQGFLDFKVKNVENNGVNYTLEYNTDYVELSDADTNEEVPISPVWNPDTSFLVMDGETTDFNKDSFIIGCERQGNTEGKYAALELDVALKPNAEGMYIGEKYTGDESASLDGNVKVIQAGDKELTLGRLSFRIKDPAAFAKLSEQDLMNVFRIKTTAEGSSAFKISHVDINSYPPYVFYDESSHLDYEFNVKNTIKSIKVNKSEQTVTAAEVFSQGNENDLLSYLNSYMQDITVTYADGAQVADTIVWGDGDKGYNCDTTWDPKGGTYTVTQQYNEDLTVTAVLNVTPVKVVGYVGDKNFIHYEDSTSIPADLAALKESLPKTARPVFSILLPANYTYDVSVSEDSWEQTAPADKDLFVDKADGEYTFAADVQESELPAWATVEANARVIVDVAVGAATPTPEVSAEVDDDGLLTITVGSVGGLSPLPNDTDFLIRMPNGEVLDPANFTNGTGGGLFEITLNSPADGQAVIKLKAEDLSNAQQAALQQAINLGNRLGSFEVAAQAEGKPHSDWAAVAAEPRTNKYINNTYEFDYSTGSAQIFNLEESMTEPPTTIALAGNDEVTTTYSGYDGTEPGSLQTVSVDSWTKTEGNIAVGETVTFEGVLADTSYTNFGRVQNPDGVKIVLKLKVVESSGQEKIDNIEDFNFNKKQVGYTSNEVQTAFFAINNIGKTDIYGLTVSVDSDSFLVVGNPAYYLATGGATNFQIKPKEGLPVGKYNATVTVSSNKTQVLDSFEIFFEVTAGPVYTLNLSADPVEAGTAVAPDGYTYAAGDTVTLKATPAEDCSFTGWEVTRGPSVSFTPSDTTDTVTFDMPSLEGLGYDDITIKAKFDESDAAKLKLQSLQLFNPDDTENDLLDSDYAKASFDPSQREYNAIVASGVDKNKVTFKINTGEGAPAITVNASVQTADGGTQTLTVKPRSGEDGVYDIEDLPLAMIAPKENLLTISLQAGSDTREYKVHVYRKVATADMVEFGYGNSPYGLIMKDDTVADKAAWKAEFDKGNCFTENFTPAGGHTGLIYYPDAWGSTEQATNYDKIDEALFVYSGESFTDPGIISLTDSLGKTIDLNTVQRKITVNKLTATDSKNLMDDFRTIAAETFDLGSNMTVDALKTLRIRPGIYAISYIFEDFDGSSVSVQRPLIVLAGRGDVNIDGFASETDAELIANRYNAKLPYENLPGFENGSRLYQYRICDVNVDRNVNMGDRNMILQYRNSGAAVVEFYK